MDALTFSQKKESRQRAVSWYKLVWIQFFVPSWVVYTWGLFLICSLPSWVVYTWGLFLISCIPSWVVYTWGLLLISSIPSWLVYTWGLLLISPIPSWVVYTWGFFLSSSLPSLHGSCVRQYSLVWICSQWPKMRKCCFRET